MATGVVFDDDRPADNENLKKLSIIWLDDTHNNSEGNRIMQKKMRSILSDYKQFEDALQCITYIQQMSKEKQLALIVNDQLGQKVIFHVHHLQQVSSIHVYPVDTKSNTEWTKPFIKVNITREFDVNI
ncbi:unnamed protein product [Adineta steineri]|uniref:Uncharacterized protein n=1 Tax=Adineta steineri TaxID=433720 RepID=A0A813Q4M6_9BILA|nr:unnamed protein product [Adineta steineri]CAF4076398.1 unnamed protein product [Adineta steineri]